VKQTKGIYFDQYDNLIVSTKDGLKFSGYLSGKYPDYNGCSKIFEEIRYPINIDVCGNEVVKVVDTSTLEYDFEIGTTP
jgi:hypothetical protein